MTIPMFEKVIHSQLVLKKEIRMGRVRTTEHHRKTVTLREQKATVERDGPAAFAAGNTSTANKDFAP